VLHNGSADEAMRSLHTAVDIARAQQATVLEVRAAISLARAEIAQRRPGDGVDFFRELCPSPPSAFDAPELREARKLL
jgi:predicted ATPase